MPRSWLLQRRTELDSLICASVLIGWIARRPLPAIFGRAGPAHMTEHSRKVLLRFEAARHRDIQDMHLARAQHFL